MSSESLSPRVVVRIVLIVLAVCGALVLIWMLRRPLSWLVMAMFIAVALSGPVTYLSRYMKRGLAIAVVYLTVMLIPLILAALIIPSLVTQANDLVGKAPQYAQDLTNFVERNDRLNDLEQKYDITGTLEEQAAKLPSKIGDAAGTLRDLGVGIVNSIFAGVTILILSIFMVAGGRGWIEGFLSLQPPDRSRRLDRALNHMSRAVGSYVAGALVQATIAGLTTYVVLLVLGVPFAAPLAVVVFLFDLLPLIGATLAAVVVGIVTLFNDFPTSTIIWVIWAIVYQQVENNIIQPQIQKRAVRVQPIIVLTSVLFGATLFGVVGALLAIPVAASVQIGILEYWDYRRQVREDKLAATVIEPGADPPPLAPA